MDAEEPSAADAPIRSYRDLSVWRKAMDIVRDIYRLADTLPRKEEYRLTSQLIRAAISVRANIAEGNARASRKDYAHFVSIARGSVAELETLLISLQRPILHPIPLSNPCWRASMRSAECSTHSASV